MAAEIEVVDGPNDEGETFSRPGKLSDRFPQLYAYEQAARFANGATPATMDRTLTGYRDPPAGVLYEDGTPATEAQMGRDVVTFLHGLQNPQWKRGNWY